MPDLEGQLERAVAALARYYGATSRSDFASLFVRSREGATAGAPLEVPNPTPAQAAAQALLNITDGGLTTPELLASIEERVGGAASSQDGNDVKGLLRVCHEPGAEGKNNSGVLLGRDIRVGSQGETQGVPLEGGGEIYSIRETLGLEGQSDSSNPINEPGEAAAGCNLAAVQVFANRLSPVSRDLGALTLFMNAIPTLEMSRAVPFIDVVLIQEGAAVQGTSEAEGRLASLSLGQFLLGNARVEGTPHPTLTATDLQVLGEQGRQPDFPGDSDGAQPSPISTAGMELFTSPQTLVNADEAHFEDSELTGNVEEQLRRQSPIIDRFRPLMTLKSLNLSVVGAGGIMSYKSGKMSLTLHDRSRLAEVSAFVRPARYGSNHILLEYGWSHPDSPAQGEPIGSDNPIGNFIGALRTKEKYQIVNSSFSFDEVGQVQIELTLSMLSTRGLRQVNIGLGPSDSTAFSTVKNIIDLVGQIRSRLNSTLAAQITGESDVIGSLTSPASVLSLSSDAIKELRKVITATNNSSSSSLGSLNRQLKDLIGTERGSTLGGAAEQLRSGIGATIARKTTELPSGPDPFLVKQTITTHGRANTIDINNPDYVSLGKLLLKFVGQPIATSGYYRDVQFIFYNFNDRASYMANRNIATFPVDRAELKDLLERQLDQMLNMTTESFIGFIDGGFISAPSAKPYGFSGFYYTPTPRNGEEAQGPQLRRAYENDAAKLASAQQEILKTAYGNTDEDDGDYEFVQPTISFVAESVPLRSNPSDPRTLLRIHIFDSTATSHTCVQQLLEAASDRSIGLINSAAAEARQSINRARAGEEGASQDTANIDVRAYNEQVNAAVTAGLLEEYPPAGERPADSRARANRLRLKGGMPALKGFISRTMPSVRYGEGASGITSAKVQSMSDPGLTTVNILRQGTTPDTPASARFNGVPLQVAPVECTLETIGCPLWSFGQQLFIDFGTGTSIDAVYGVVGVDHTIGPGEYKTTVKLTPMGSYAKYESLFRNVRDATIVMDALESPPEQQ